MSGRTELRFARTSRDLARPAPACARVRAVARDGFLRAAGHLVRPRRRPQIRCLYLHHVFDDEVDRFARTLRALLGLGRFVDTGTLFALLRGESEPSEPIFHVSFDDGFDNNARNAAPVLAELGIAAAFFVTTSLIDASDEEVARARWNADPMPTRMMSWRQLRDLRQAGHTIGSHTRTHARLSSISADPQRLRDEVLGSKQEIERALGEPCRYFAWPFGTDSDVDDRALAMIAEAGYEGCFSAVRGPCEPRATQRLRVPRHHVEAGWPLSHVRYFALGGGE